MKPTAEELEKRVRLLVDDGGLGEVYARRRAEEDAAVARALAGVIDGLGGTLERVDIEDADADEPTTALAVEADMGEKARLRGLSVLQPWATCIIGRPRVPGPKGGENRTWGPREFADAKRRKVKPTPIWIAVHASLGDYWKSRADLAEGMHAVRSLWPALPPMDELPRGALLGIAEVLDVLSYAELSPELRRWATPGVTHFWVFGKRYAFDAPIPARGGLGLWRLQDDHYEAARELYARNARMTTT